MSSADLVYAYVAAWLKHGAADATDEGKANLKGLIELVLEDFVYEDVPSGHSYMSRDYKPKIQALSTRTDSRRFAIEFSATLQGMTARSAAIGTIGQDGKIASHRDYHNGASPAPDSRPDGS
jgi:hypothetical protein